MAQLPTDVMKFWQSRHGRLQSTKLMQEFLIRAEATEISRYPEEWIRSAFGQEKTLQIALLILDWRAAIEIKDWVTQHNKPEDGMDRLKRSHGVEEKPKVSSSSQTLVELDLVGESFYTENFDSVRQTLGDDPKSQHQVKLKLVLDPGNPFSQSGKAVKVCHGDMTLGFVPERIAPSIYPLVERQPGQSFVEATLWFDLRQGQRSRNSVRVKAQRPPASEVDKRQQGSTSRIVGGKSQLQLDTEAWERSHPRAQPMSPSYVGGPTGTAVAGHPVKKLRVSSAPFRMKFFCEKCQGDAKSRSRKCVICDSLRGAPRSAAKTLSASRGKMLELRAQARKEKLTRKRAGEAAD